MLTAIARNILPPSLYERLKDAYLRTKLPPAGLTSTEYWSRHHVTLDETQDVEASRRFIRYRRYRYIGTPELMPTVGFSGKTVLDYGCGPGIESAAFGIDSPGVNLICADVSKPALMKAKKLLALHGINARFVEIAPDGYFTALDPNSVDVINCSGVLHHVKQPEQVLLEFRRILKPGGRIQIMVYNRDSVYMHLYVAYESMIKLRRFPGATKEAAFRMSTDGPNCPISEAWSVDQFIAKCKSCYLSATFAGTGFDGPHELSNIAERHAAIYDHRLDEESRNFLRSLTFTERGTPQIHGRDAGIYACFTAVPV